MGRINHRSSFQHSLSPPPPHPEAPPWISHLQGENGGFLVFPEAHCCHFPFGTCGVSLLGHGCETETKGASPSYTLSPQLCLGTAHQGSLGPTVREVPAPARDQSQGTAGGEGQGRAAGTCLAQTGFPCCAPQWWQLIPLPHPMHTALPAGGPTHP